MERFLKIDWNPAIEDIIDDVFINDERMKTESAMYKILIGNFKDPFKDIEDDYAKVDLNLIKEFGGDLSLSDEDDSINEEKQDEQDTKSSGKKQTKNIPKKNNSTPGEKENNFVQERKENVQRPYIPGIRKPPSPYPRQSHMNKIQHAVCLRVLLQSFSNQKKGMSVDERKEFESYMALQEIISKEQNEFLEFVKMKWDNTKLSVKYNKYVISRWEAKMQKFQELPRYYTEYKSITCSANQNIVLKFISCLQQASPPKVTLPVLDRPCLLRANGIKMLKKYQTDLVSDKETQHSRLPVSQDTYCERFAVNNKVDLVISSSAIKCLMNNISDNSNSWVIPVVIKSHNGKNIAYIDKKLPPIAATIPQKNTWVYKHILRYLFIDAESNSAEEATCTEEYKYNNTESLNSNDEPFDHLKMYEEDLYSTEAQSDNSIIDNKCSSEKNNVIYNLFTISPETYDQNELMTDTIKNYQVLVRTKIDAIELLPDGKSQFSVLAPKMEHQLAFGAEATTLNEGLQQWVSLIFRPETSLARVRISADTSEIIQIERHTSSSLSSEMKRLYNIKVEDSLKILYNVIETLSSLTPGHYILRHTAQNGPFIILYKQVEEYGKNVFDLHTICLSETFHTIPNEPWPPIDRMLVTPSHRCFSRMPAMFFPSSNLENDQKSSKGRGYRKKNDNLNTQGPLRRSLRGKK